MTVVAVLVATEGSAPGSLAAPPWADVDGHPLVWHAARRLREAGVTRIVLVVDTARDSLSGVVDEAFGGTVSCVTAGRSDSLHSAFTQALAVHPSVVLVHDPARAFAPVAMIHRVVDAVRTGADVVVPVLPVVDTIRAAGSDGQVSGLVDRERLRIVQSPQGFRPDVLRRRYGQSGSPTEPADDGAPSVGAPGETPGADEVAAAVAAGVNLTTVEGHADADRVRATGGNSRAATATDPATTGRVAVGPPGAAPRGGRSADG